jgi:hypothetical protein
LCTAFANAQLVTLFDVLERRALDKATDGDGGDRHDAKDANADGDAGGAASEANSRRSAGTSVDSANSSSRGSDAGDSSERSGGSERARGGDGANGENSSDAEKSASSSSTEEGDAAYEHAELRAVKHTRLPMRDVWASFWRVATSRHEFVGPYDSAPFHLGSASAVLVIDKCGTMAEPMALPVRVLLPQYQRRRKVTDTSAAEPGDRIADFGVSLALHRPSTHGAPLAP